MYISWEIVCFLLIVIHFSKHVAAITWNCILKLQHSTILFAICIEGPQRMTQILHSTIGFILLSR